MTCETCGQELSVGAWPWCPHGHSETRYFQDEVPGGFVVENGFDTPTRFYSHSEHERALAARGLQIGAKWAGPHDRHLQRWDVPCSATLESARILLSRKKSDPFVTEPEEARVPITVTDSAETFRYEVKA